MRLFMAIGDGARGGTRLRVVAVTILVARADFGQKAAQAIRLVLQRRSCV